MPTACRSSSIEQQQQHGRARPMAGLRTTTHPPQTHTRTQPPLRKVSTGQQQQHARRGTAAGWACLQCRWGSSQCRRSTDSRSRPPSSTTRDSTSGCTCSYTKHPGCGLGSGVWGLEFGLGGEMCSPKAWPKSPAGTPRHCSGSAPSRSTAERRVPASRGQQEGG